MTTDTRIGDIESPSEWAMELVKLLRAERKSGLANAYGPIMHFTVTDANAARLLDAEFRKGEELAKVVEAAVAQDTLVGAFGGLMHLRNALATYRSTTP